MKKAKSFIAAMLAVIMAVCMIPFASAVEAPTSYVTWSYDGPDDETFIYVGSETARQFITCACSYTANETGYYRFSSSSCNIQVSETFDDLDELTKKAHGVRNFIPTANDDYDYFTDEIYYFEKGETVAIGLMLFSQEEPTKLDIVYLGAEIVDMTITDGELDNLMLGCDVPEDESEFSLYLGADIIFDTGKKMHTGEVKFETADGKNLKAGENAVNADFLNDKIAMTVTTVKVEDVVSEMSLSNYENYTYIYEDYKGYYNGKDITDEYITVKFTDGTGLACPYDGAYRRADFKNGRSYYVFARYNDYAKTLELGFASEVNATGWSDDCYVVTSYDCELVAGDMDHNLEMLEIYLNFLLDNFASSEKSLSDLFYCIKNVFKNASDCYEYVIKHLINTYLGK